MLETGLSHYSINGCKSVKKICYSSLKYIKYDKKPKIVIYLADNYKEEDYEFYQWILNSEETGSCFVTKDVREGFKKGFEIRYETDWKDFYFNIIMLRLINEFGDKYRIPYLSWRKEGADIKEAIFLAHFYKIDDDVFNAFYIGNCNHGCFYPNCFENWMNNNIINKDMVQNRYCNIENCYSDFWDPFENNKCKFKSSDNNPKEFLQKLRENVEKCVVS